MIFLVLRVPVNGLQLCLMVQQCYLLQHCLLAQLWLPVMYGTQSLIDLHD